MKVQNRKEIIIEIEEFYKWITERTNIKIEKKDIEIFKVLRDSGTEAPYMMIIEVRK